MCCFDVIEKLHVTGGDIVIVKTNSPNEWVMRLSQSPLGKPVLIMRPDEDMTKISLERLEPLVEAARRARR